MKKTLVAIAALAAFGAQAQSSVSITGNVDVGYQVKAGDDSSTTGEVAQKGIAANGSSTTTIGFKVVEDLGSGLKAEWSANNDFNPVQANTLNGALDAQAHTGTFFNSQQYLGLDDANLGKVRFGTINSAVLEANGEAQPFGTGVGSGYSAGFGRNGTTGKFGVAGFVGASGIGNRVIRTEKMVRYDTPTVQGFSASYGLALKNSANDNGATTANVNTNGAADIGLKYANGPLKLAYGQATYTSGANQASGSAAQVGDTIVVSNLDANGSVKNTYFAGNYTIGAVTAYAGWTSTKTNAAQTTAASIENMTSTNLAIKYQVNGALSLMANSVKVDSKRTDNKDGKLTGVGADYALSKRTTAYVRYESFDTYTASKTAGAQTNTAIGLRHAF